MSLRLAVLPALLLTIALVAPSAASTGPMLLTTHRSEALLAEGREHLLAFRLGEAEATFRRLAARPDGGPAAFYHLATASLWRAFVRDEPRLFDVFFGRADTLRALLSEAPRSIWRDYLDAELSLQVTLAAAKSGRHVKAVWSARAAFKGFENVIAAQPDFYEAYKGLGLLHLAVGSLPGGFRHLLGFLGYEGSVSRGMAELQQAGSDSRFNREEAVVYRALALLMLDRTDPASVELLRRLHEERPASLLFAHIYGFVLLEQRRASEARAVLRTAHRLASDPAYFYIDYTDYYLADAAFKMDRFAEAERLHRSYLSRHRGPALKAMANLHVGLALEMQGRREEALAFYRAVESTRGFDEDDVALREATARIAAPMTEQERLLLLARNAFDAGRYADAEALLRPLLAGDAAGAVRAEAAYRLGRVCQATGRLDEALSRYQEAIDHTADPHAKWRPWSQFHRGEIHAARGDEARARAAFRRAMQYRAPFDYHQALEQNARAALDRLGS